ncbi:MULTISPECIES: protein adenylyltransferase SelO [Elizabethkingia]|uniref:protein adenylyltransferase SelO n=1 Tax=Elizabethkingia TaxID=308865 RepID=UPI0020A0AE92|nr:YdiU family protein [Elizabethkingia sp. S0634]MCP1250422.1 YdiU family protein [Elizabethkingia sp. S0634]
MMNLPEIRQPFKEAFPGDNTYNNYPRQTPGVLYALVEPMEFPKPELILFNEELGEEIMISKDNISLFSGQILPEGVEAYATAYAGHQFGNWAGQLGDGRAINIGEVKSRSGMNIELQYKGAGSTPYSRNADGRAVFRSSLREYLMSEAMYHLGISTTRALSLVKTGENVIRDMFYNGHPEAENGAVIIRTAESFIRFGHFELLAARKETDTLKQLMDWVIERYFPEIKGETDTEKYLSWFREVAQRTADTIIDWFRVGFVHGVMNTDNMSILGLTIDYGPFSMLDEYSLNFTPNTTDLPGRRYAFGKQANIAHWNLFQLANAVFTVINDQEGLEEILNDFSKYFWTGYDKMMAEKLGLDGVKESDQSLLLEWQKLMDELKLDYTLFFSLLEKVDAQTNAVLHFEPCFYYNLTQSQKLQLENFVQHYVDRKLQNTISAEESLQKMQRTNPKFILRNYLLFQCIEETDQGDLTLLNKLLKALESPYEELYPEFSVKRPDWAGDQPGCSTLSCSS